MFLSLCYSPRVVPSSFAIHVVHTAFFWHWDLSTEGCLRYGKPLLVPPKLHPVHCPLLVTLALHLPILVFPPAGVDCFQAMLAWCFASIQSTSVCRQIQRICIHSSLYRDALVYTQNQLWNKKSKSILNCILILKLHFHWHCRWLEQQIKKDSV